MKNEQRPIGRCKRQQKISLHDFGFALNDEHIVALEIDDADFRPRWNGRLIEANGLAFSQTAIDDDVDFAFSELHGGNGEVDFADFSDGERYLEIAAFLHIAQEADELDRGKHFDEAREEPRDNGNEMGIGKAVGENCAPRTHGEERQDADDRKITDASCVGAIDVVDVEPIRCARNAKDEKNAF